MITTLTPNTVAIAQRPDLSGVFAVIIIGLLLALLIYKEFLDTEGQNEARRKQLVAALNIGIVPLLITLSMVIVAKIVQALI